MTFIFGYVILFVNINPLLDNGNTYKQVNKGTKKMKGTIVSGKELSEKILQDLQTRISYNIDTLQRRAPKLVVITVGEDPASKVYVRNKERACEKTGIIFENIRFNTEDNYTSITTRLLDVIQSDDVDGVIIQLPIVSITLTDVEKQKICELVPDRLDVDGFGQNSKLAVYEGCKDEDAFYPCTPSGIMKLLDEAAERQRSIKPDFSYRGLNALVIGRSDIVGKPVANMLMARNMTVTIAHSKTPIEELRRLVEHADVIISAVGKELPVQTMRSKAIVIVDVGMNRDKDGKLCGDLTEDWKADNSTYYTPVPGGVGPMTVCMLMSNVFKSYLKNTK